MSSGVRCAETTRVSWRMPNSWQTSAAAFNVGQSESLPMMMPTTGLMDFFVFKLVAKSNQPRRALRRRERFLNALSQGGDVPHLPARRAERLAVNMHMRARDPERFAQARRSSRPLARAQQVDHRRRRRAHRGRPKRPAHHRAHVILELRADTGFNRVMP